MKFSKILTLGLFVALLNTSSVRGQEASSGKDVSAKAVAISEVEMGWTTQAILSSYVGDNHAEGYIDLLIPLLQNDNGMLFLYPRFGLSSDVDPGYSMGLGARHYIPAIDAIIGGNVFYDRYDSPGGNYYNQLGLGLEVLTRWVDARFNYYIPDSSPNVVDSQKARSRSVSTSSAWGQPYATGYTIRQPYTTTTRTTTVNQLFERFEDTMEGLDAEVGVLTPWLEQYIALRWFAGYYNFNNSYGGDISGVKARAELRFSEKLAIDATYYEDEEVTGSNWLFGVRMSIPIFMENLADGRSPFQGSFSGMFDGVNMGVRGQGNSGIQRGGSASTSAYAPSPFAAMAPAPSFASASKKGSTVRDRMTEQLLRLSGARTSQSDFIENLGKRDVDVDIKTKTRIVVIEDSIVFVDNARGTATNPGTFENPLSGIQGGVNRASNLFGNRGDVFVSGTGTTYTEDVVDAGSSVKIWGGGRGFPANGGRRFTHGSQPVLDGGFQVTNIPQFSLSGFTIINGFGGAGDGVNVNDTSSVVIEYNNISAPGADAVQVVSTNGVININNNVLHNSGLGLNVDVTADSEMTATTMISNNQFLNNTGNGMNLNIDSDDGSTTNTTITNNEASGNGGRGFDISIDVEDNAPNGGGTLTFQGNTANGNAADGLRLDLDADDMGGRAFIVNIFDNQFLNSVGGEGINIDLDIDGNPNDSTVVLTISGNRIAGNALDGLNLNADVSDTDLVSFAILNNQFLNNGGDGLELSLDADESISVNISGNSFMTHGGDSIRIDVGGSSGPVNFFSTLDNTSAGAGSGNALGDNGTANATGFIILDGATINFPNPGNIAD